jgi:hypothetical protein
MLTDPKVRNAKPRERAYKLFDGGGLFLLVNPNGSRLWRLKYRRAGFERTLSIGSYPVVTLAEARDERDKAHRLLREGTRSINRKAGREGKSSCCGGDHL